MVDSVAEPGRKTSQLKELGPEQFLDGVVYDKRSDQAPFDRIYTADWKPMSEAKEPAWFDPALSLMKSLSPQAVHFEGDADSILGAFDKMQDMGKIGHFISMKFPSEDSKSDKVSIVLSASDLERIRGKYADPVVNRNVWDDFVSRAEGKEPPDPHGMEHASSHAITNARKAESDLQANRPIYMESTQAARQAASDAAKKAYKEKARLDKVGVVAKG